MMEELESKLLWRYAAAQNRLGRLCLNCRWYLQILRAQWLMYGNEVLKRGVDVLLSAMLLVLFSPLLGLIAVAVWIEDGGPVFFAQTRVGKFGREFKMFKVRSMCLDAEKRLPELFARNQHKEGITFKIKDDPRITKVGKWLRKYSFDELPQLYNVFRGDMSLVGPRPPVPREVARYSLADRRRLAAKPGITCVWQISGRSEIDFSGQVQLDVNYIESHSLWFDFAILARTIPAVISGRGAC